MKHYGDITKINVYDVPIVDVITGGSPCQDLSVAGKRAGLAGERSGLFMEQIRIVREMRQRDRLENGRPAQFVRPRFMVWENVPGAFSSGNPKGADFAAVIEEIIKVAEPDSVVSVCVPDGGWTKSGCYYAEDGSWSIAWRLHDAQFWGVPQRRKRISLVADFNGLAAPEVLFERKGLSGDSEQGFSPRQATAGKAENSVGDSSYTLKIRGGVDIDSHGRAAGKGALVQAELSGTLGVSQDQTLIQPCLNGWDVQSKHIQSPDGIAEALYSGECRYGGGESYVMQNDAIPINTMVGTRDTPEMRTTFGIGEPGDPQFTLSSAHEHAVFACGFKPRNGAEAKSIGFEEEKAPTISTDENYGVLCLNDQGGSIMNLSYEQTATLRANMKHHEPIVYNGETVTSPTNKQMPSAGDPCHTLTDDNRNYLVYENHSQDSRYKELGDVSETVNAKYGTGGNNQPLVLNNSHSDSVLMDAFQHHGYRENETCGTLTKDQNCGIRGDTPLVVEAVPIEGNGQRESHIGNGYGDSGDPMFTLNSTEHHAVAYGLDKAMTTGGNCTAGGNCVHEEYTPPLTTDRPHAVAYGISPYASNAMKSDNPNSGVYEADTSRTLDLNGGSPACNQGGIAIVQGSNVDVLCVGNGQVDQAKLSPLVGALNCMHDQQAVMVTAVDCQNSTEDAEKSGTLQSSAGHNLNSNNVCRTESVVRRLTPDECASLQGFPRDWCNIGDWVDSKGRVHKDSDSPKYKAYGNSIAVGYANKRSGFWCWLARRICAQYERQITMASLFDGIGGFPLAFQAAGAIPVWASEIEEFPIAVTKVRFPEVNDAN